MYTDPLGVALIVQQAKCADKEQTVEGGGAALRGIRAWLAYRLIAAGHLLMDEMDRSRFFEGNLVKP